MVRQFSTDIVPTVLHLADALISSRRLYIAKRDYFRDLSEVHRSEMREWYHMDRRPIVENGEVKSVYRHSTSKGMYSIRSLHKDILTAPELFHLMPYISDWSRWGQDQALTPQTRRPCIFSRKVSRFSQSS
jgi:hypothetical protein